MSALYNKYRPQIFDEIYGQPAIVQTLRNQIINDHIGHAYIFQGTRGTAKTSTARIFAKAINCLNPTNGNPCLQCTSCTDTSVNPDMIEIDAASNNSVENIRNLVETVKYKPSNHKYKVYIIDEVHMLSNSSFNALLKTLEEPPEYAVFILCTTDFTKIPDTIKSRCQIYNFKLIKREDIKNALSNILVKENIDCLNNDSCLDYLADKANGSLRDAISLLDQCITMFSDKDTVQADDIKELFGDVLYNVVQAMVDVIKAQNVLGCIDLLHSQYYNGTNLLSLAKGLYKKFFNDFMNQAETIDGIIFERYTRILGELMPILEKGHNSLTAFEVALIKMCKPEMESDYNSVVQRMNNLEKRLDEMSNTTEINTEDESFPFMYYNINHTEHVQVL